jgi:hypothetical protein
MYEPVRDALLPISIAQSRRLLHAVATSVLTAALADFMNQEIPNNYSTFRWRNSEHRGSVLSECTHFAPGLVVVPHKPL